MHNGLDSRELLVLKRNPALRVTDFDDVSVQKQVVCEVPSEAGGDYRFLISGLAIRKLDYAFDGRRNVREAVHHAYPDDTDLAARRAFRMFVLEQCLPCALLVSGSSESPGLSMRSNQNQMLFELPLVSPAMVGRIARVFLPLYMQPVVRLLVPLIVAIMAIALWSFDGGGKSLGSLDLQSVLAALGLLALGLFFHEFGHATAALKAGCERIRIGVGWYVCFFVFYSDLSESWRLPRRERLVIDAGGMYFQSIFTAVVASCNFVWPHAALEYAMIALSLSLLWNLNPFFRMDGYWMASDFFGVANLREEAKGAIGSFFVLLSGRADESIDMASSRLSRTTRIWLVVYAVLSSIFLAYFVSRLLFAILPAMFMQIRIEYAGLVSWDASTSSSLAALVGAMLWKATFFCLLVYLAYRILRSPARSMWEWMPFRKKV